MYRYTVDLDLCMHREGRMQKKTIQQGTGGGGGSSTVDFGRGAAAAILISYTLTLTSYNVDLPYQ